MKDIKFKGLPLTLDLQFFASEEEDTTQEQQTETQEENVNTTEESDNNTETTKEENVKTFTQDELEDIISKRLERERKKYSDYEDVKKKAKTYEKELEEKRLAELSEKERAEELAKKAEEDKSVLEQELEQLRNNVKQEKIQNEFIKVATRYNIEYIDDALKLADLSDVQVGEEGIEGVEDVIKNLVENKPFLVATKRQKKPIGESTNSSTEKSDKTADQLLKEAAEKARLTGKPEDKMAYAKLKRELS